MDGGGHEERILPEPGGRDEEKGSRRAVLAALLALLVLLLGAAGEALADSTLTLPRGVGRLRVRPIYSFISERWNERGDAELLTGDLNNRNLNSDVFSDLSTLERLYDYRARSLSLGTSQVESQLHIFVLALAGEYGITDRLTLGLVVPIVHARHLLRRLDLDRVRVCNDQQCGVGTNPGDTNITKSDARYLPLDHDKDPDTKLLAPLTKDDVLDILDDDFGYQRLQDWSDTGVGDIELGLKYRILTWRYWATSVQGGLRIPTGKLANPNNLLAVDFGDGQTDIGLYWQNDFTPTRAMRLNLTLRYTAQLPDFRFKRVPPRADVPVSKKTDVENVWRDPGDVFEVDCSVAYTFRGVLTPYAGYLFTLKGQDDVRGNRGLSYRSLMDETALRNHQLEAGLLFSTLPWVVSGRTRVPLMITLSYSRSLAGINNAAISNTLALDMAGYFKVL